MVLYCAVINCPNHWIRKKGVVVLHKIPKNNCEQWVEFLKIQNGLEKYEKKKSTRICHLHFDDFFYIKHQKASPTLCQGAYPGPLIGKDADRIIDFDRFMSNYKKKLLLDGWFIDVNVKNIKIFNLEGNKIRKMVVVDSKLYAEIFINQKFSSVHKVTFYEEVNLEFTFSLQN